MGSGLSVKRKRKKKKWVRVFRRRKLKIILRSSECLGSIELIRYTLEKNMATKTEKKKKNHKSHESLRKTKFTRLDS